MVNVLISGRRTECPGARERKYIPRDESLFITHVVVSCSIQWFFLV